MSTNSRFSRPAFIAAYLPSSTHPSRLLNSPSRQRQQGLSLIELIAFMLIVSVALAGLMSAFNLSMRRSADPMLQKQRLAVAESLLEEIVHRPFTWCDPDDANLVTASSAAGCATLAEASGPESGEARGSSLSPFDNVNDYHGLTMNAGILSAVDGTSVIAGLENYRASVNVANAGADLGLAADAALRVTVTVTSADNEQTTLTDYVARHSPNATP
ncbi:type IV pilus modification PilV family protein [Chitinimonas lacunae]|uniref:Prepilin-type N-terminal cleavage/methylation domain-containing protein n=1 Tax=Chitinimonas lacunae TaxID=1963018 RepID=A0ABV8MWR2_9NEIS